MNKNIIFPEKEKRFQEIKKELEKSEISLKKIKKIANKKSKKIKNYVS